MPKINLPKKKRDNVRTTRKKDYQDIYQDKRWKLIRSFKLTISPLCERCIKKNIPEPATEAHHIVPFDRGRNREEIEELAFDVENTMSVCKPCHKIIHEELIHIN